MATLKQREILRQIDRSRAHNVIREADRELGRNLFLLALFWLALSFLLWLIP